MRQLVDDLRLRNRGSARGRSSGGAWTTPAAASPQRPTALSSKAALALSAVRRVEIHCDEASTRSAAVPRRLGYRLDRVEDDEVTAPGQIGRRRGEQLAEQVDDGLGVIDARR